MELQSDFEKICEQYLLGELSESECQEMEEAYFADDSLFERFLAVKDDLLDAYARGELKGQRLTQFEQHYLGSKARRQKVQEARDLIQMASTTRVETATTKKQRSEAKSGTLWWWQSFSTTQPLGWRVAIVAALLLLIAGSWIVVRQVQDRAARRSADEQARHATKPPDEKSTNGNAAGPAPTTGLNINGERATSSPSPSASAKPEVAAKPAPATSAQIASLTLLPLSTRETGSANNLTLSQEQRAVRLNLVFGDAVYDGLEISVRTVDGQQVIRRGGLKAISNKGGKTATITFDSSLLDRQDYIATLRGRTKNGSMETIAEYFFRVQHTAPQ